MTRDDNDLLREGKLPDDPFEGGRPFAPGELQEEAKRREASARLRREAEREPAAEEPPETPPLPEEAPVLIPDGSALDDGPPEESQPMPSEEASYARGTTEANKRQKGKKRSDAELAMQLARNHLHSLFRGSDGQCYARIPIKDHLELRDLGSDSFKAWLRNVYRKARGGRKLLGSTATSDVVNALQAIAEYDADERQVFNRVARIGDRVFVDLCTPDWKVAEVSPRGWRVIPGMHGPIFRRVPGMQALPVPEAGGSLAELRELVNLPGDQEWALTLFWLVSALRGCGPYPLLVVQGEHGAAKTTLVRLLRRLVDPNAINEPAPVEKPEDFDLVAMSQHVVVLDNLSGMPPWLSDALCRLATGSGALRRKLYTGRDLERVSYCGPAILNGIDDMLGRSDLASRSASIYLRSISKQERRLESEVLEGFDRVQPRLLGALFDAVACALANEGSVELERAPRMADAARWATAAEPALGLEPGAILAALEEAQRCALYQGLEHEPIAGALLAVPYTFWSPRGGRWEGSAKDLLADLRDYLDDESWIKDRSWPRSPAAAGRKIRRLAPALREYGVGVHFGREKGRRLIYLEKLTEGVSHADEVA